MAFFGQSIAGLRDGTEDNLILDAGQLVLNANMELYEDEFTPAGLAYSQAILAANTWTDPNGNVVAPKILGATRGGTTIKLDKTERQVEADGRRTNIKGFQRIDMIDPKISTSLIEVADPDTLRLILGSSVTQTLTNFYKIRPTLYPKATDYYGNITLFATISGAFDPNNLDDNGDPLPIPIAVVFENARVNNVQDIPIVDKNEGVAQLEITAHALASNSFQIPMYVLLPLSESDLTLYGY